MDISSYPDFLEEHRNEDDPILYDYRQYYKKLRYRDKKIFSPEADLFIGAFMGLLGLYNQNPPIGTAKKDYLDYLKALDLPFKGDKAKEEILYLELRNAAALLMETANSESYHRRFMGLVVSGEDTRKEQMCADLWKISIGLAGRLYIEEEASLLIKAINDEFVSRTEGALSLEDSYRECRKVTV